MCFVKMQFKSLLLVLVVVQNCTNVVLVLQSSNNVKSFSSLTITELPSKCNYSINATDSPKFNLRTPFMDIELQNDQSLHVVQEVKSQQIFALHGNELYQVLISHDEKHLSLIGSLVGSVGESNPMSVEVIYWRNSLIIVVGLEEHLEVYQIYESIIQKRANSIKGSGEMVPQFEAIQQLTLPGKLQRHFLSQIESEEILLVIAVDFTKLYGKLRTFEWTNTYFNPIEEMTVPSMHILQMVGRDRKYLITGKTIRHLSKVILTVHEIQRPQMTLRVVQILTVNFDKVYGFTFHGVNYFIGCSIAQRKCTYFRMVDGQFYVYKQLSYSEMNFHKFVAGEHFLVGALRNDIMVFYNKQLNCYANLVSNETDISSIFIHKNSKQQIFILLSYMRPFHTLLRVVHIEAEEGTSVSSIASNLADATDSGILFQHQHHFEKSIGKLRSLLLQRKAAMDVFRQIESQVNGPEFQTMLMDSVSIKNGQIRVVKLIDAAIRSPTQLMQKIGHLWSKFGHKRPTRSVAYVGETMKFSKLFVTNLHYAGPLIPDGYLEFSSSPMSRLTLRVPVSAKVLQTTEFLVPQRSRGIRQTSNSSSISTSNFSLNLDSESAFGSDVLSVRKVETASINGVPWAEFYESLFLKDRNTKVTGRLILQAETRIGNLETSLINDRGVDSFFNLKQPQIVNANITFSAFFVTDLTVKKLNGLNFSADIVFRGNDTIIESPVSMHVVSVVNDLIIVNDDSSIKAKSNQKLQQHYTGKVIINGSLNINNLITDQPHVTKVLINNNTFSSEQIRRMYLLAKEPQNLTIPAMFGKAEVTLPSLNTLYLNSYLVSHHLFTTNTSNLSEPLLLLFKAVQVNGNIFCESQKSNVLTMAENAIFQGQIANITGPKQFVKDVTVDNLLTLHLNGLPVNELLVKTQLSERPLPLGGVKSFTKVIVGKANVQLALNCTYLNNLPVNELLNYDYYLDTMQLNQQLHVENIVFQRINGIDFDAVFKKFMVNNYTLVLHKDLIFEGSVKFGEAVSVQKINELNWDAYVAGLVKLNNEATIEGAVHFLDELIITDHLTSVRVNGANMHDLLKNILSKTKPQFITGAYSFDSLQLTNVDVSIVNDMLCSALLETGGESVVAFQGDLVVPKVVVKNDLEGSFAHPFQFDSLSNRILELPRKSWRQIVVLGDAHWNDSCPDGRFQLQELLYLFRNAVRRGSNQVITGNVRFKKPVIATMEVTSSFPGAIDVEIIADDCLFRNMSRGSAPVILAPKVFTKPIIAQNVKVTGPLNAKFLNTLDVMVFNASMFRVSGAIPIEAILQFKTSPVIGRIGLQGLVNGIEPGCIYHAYDIPLPAVRIRNLIVNEQLFISQVNDMSLNFLLENRIMKNGPAMEVFGFLTFENLVLNTETLLRSVNGIAIDNIVYKKSQHLQAITGSKNLNGTLHLAGPVHVLNISGSDVIAAFQQSVFRHENYEFDELMLEQALFAGGFHWNSEDMVAVTLSDLKDDNNFEYILASEVDAIDNHKHKSIMYLDEASQKQIVWQFSNASEGSARLHEVTRVSPCEHNYIYVNHSKANKYVYLANITSNLIKHTVKGLQLKVKNYCRPKYGRVRSKITIATSKFSKVFGMKKFIENVAILSLHHEDHFLLLHAVDPVADRNEIRILRVLKDNVWDVQSLADTIGTLMELKQGTNQTILITRTLVNHYPAIHIYDFSLKVKKFTIWQTLDGDYDMAAVSRVSDIETWYLILGCRQCAKLTIFECSSNKSKGCAVFQIIQLEVPVNKLFTFSIDESGENEYLLVVAGDYYQLYEFSHLQGWQQFTYGYFRNLEIAIPLVEHLPGGENAFSLLACGEGKCSLVEAFIN